jgi:protein-L-isoaspartate(D-aspartate) O-methyltransferase
MTLVDGRSLFWALVLLVAIVTLACEANGATSSSEEALTVARERMVRDTIETRNVRDVKTLAAMRKVPRHLFIPPERVRDAYGDYPLPIGNGQTISQPYIVAFMTEALQLRGGEKVLEVGTGSGYQAAVLAEIAAEVFSIEIIPELAEKARDRLSQLGYKNVTVRAGDGYLGWPSEAPFDAIMVTAAAPRIPQPLKEQLKEGGRLVLPVGDFDQDLVVVTRTKDRFTEKRVLAVRFVPMTGRVRD